MKSRYDWHAYKQVLIKFLHSFTVQSANAVVVRCRADTGGNRDNVESAIAAGSCRSDAHKHELPYATTRAVSSALDALRIPHHFRTVDLHQGGGLIMTVLYGTGQQRTRVRLSVLAH